MSAMFLAGLKGICGGFVWLLTLGQVSTREDSANSSPTKNNNGDFISTDAIVSVLFIIHVAAVVAFIFSHCRVAKQKSQ